MRALRTTAFVLLAASALAALSACGGSETGDDTATAVSTVAATETAAPTVTETVAATTEATSEATAAATAAASPAGSSDDDLLALGREIFNKTAGGVGCAFCHGADGKGDGPAMVGAPANRGASEQLVREKLGSVPDMSGIKLTDREIDAVVAYLAYLAEQP